jgi:hypothetical protein
MGKKRHKDKAGKEPRAESADIVHQSENQGHNPAFSIFSDLPPVLFLCLFVRMTVSSNKKCAEHCGFTWSDKV